jgi:hypothetical protein
MPFIRVFYFYHHVDTPFFYVDTLGHLFLYGHLKAVFAVLSCKFNFEVFIVCEVLILLGFKRFYFSEKSLDWGLYSGNSCRFSNAKTVLFLGWGCFFQFIF